MRPPKILLASSELDTASGLYRAALPFVELGKQGQCEIVIPQTKSIVQLPEVVAADIVFMLRPHTQGHAAVADMCEQTQTPLWIDYDDCLPLVPKHNSNHKALMSSLAKGPYWHILEQAKAITVTTPALKKALRLTNEDKCTVLPNALPEAWYMYEEEVSERPIILWRGSKTHDHDLMTHLDALDEIVTKSKAAIIFMGEMKNQTNVRLRYVLGKHAGFLNASPNFYEYLRTAATIDPKLIIHPLAVTPFNECKSGCIYNEGLAIGAPVVSSLKYNADWQTKTAEQFADRVIKAYENAHQEFMFAQAQIDTLEEVNVIRSEVLRKIVEEFVG